MTMMSGQVVLYWVVLCYGPDNSQHVDQFMYVIDKSVRFGLYYAARVAIVTDEGLTSYGSAVPTAKTAS